MAGGSGTSDTMPFRSNLVVGVGASAGGLDAFKAFFVNMPARSGMAFVLIQHLDPHHESLLVELLTRHAPMPVLLAEDGMPIEADKVFVIPPNAVLTIESGILRVTTPAPPREQRKPIDMFFASLAEDQQEKAVSIILSGSGSDGSAGVKAIKEHGGLTLAQAGFDERALLGMPSSAVATGLIDDVMPVERMPERLLSHQRHMSRVDERKGPGGTRLDATEHLTKICALLNARLGHDFSGYKESTLIRRIQRRMQVLQIDGVPEYIDRLRKEPDQLDLLFRDFLIGVTQFFRDPDAFSALESDVLPKLLENNKSGDPIRVWVPGCATGEEVYSIAILLKEAMTRLEIAPKVQIFASDLDEHAVAIARHGRYRKPLPEVSAERLRRWFSDDGDDYCAIKEIREMCVYSTHNLTRDPPFAKLDLISCRNLLIYLDPSLQSRLMRTFHYALRSDGYLFLGAAEGVARHGGLFATLSKKHRLFQKRGDARASLPSMLSADAVLVQSAQVRSTPARSPRSLSDTVEQRARQALEKYSPAYVVVNQQHDVLRFSGRTGAYIEPSQGTASLNLFSMLRKDLAPAVRTVLQEAVATQRGAVHDDVIIATNGLNQVLKIVVEPISQAGDELLYVIAFQDRGFIDPSSNSSSTPGGDETRAQAFEKELRAVRAQLQDTIDDLKSANEELKSSNEEYQSVNEEFQFTNEELESSKEELQSLNEELQTLNGELNMKNEALSDANSDIKNFLDSTQIATLFLDRDFRIRNFTPAISEIFRLRTGDRGRPIGDIVTHLNYPGLTRDIENVLSSLTMVETEVTLAGGGGTFLMRIRPYRTVGETIAGVVIAFVDITERKRAEEERAFLAAIINSSRDAIIGHALDGSITSWNAGAEKIFGFTAHEAVGKPVTMLLPPDRLNEEPEILARIGRGERIDHYDTVRRHKDGSSIPTSLTVSPIVNANGTIAGASNIARDITQRKRDEDLHKLMMNELNHRVKNTLATVQSIAARSLKGVLDPESRNTFEARLVSLSRTHDLLAMENWRGTSLRDVLLQELDPYRSLNGERFLVEGPEFDLLPKAALALGLAFHELATNAAKYGALSIPTGQVHVSWELSRDAEPSLLRLKWVESGGPAAERTQRKGFGSTIIERNLTLELDGSVQLKFDPGGLICLIEIPISSKTRGNE